MLHDIEAYSYLFVFVKKGEVMEEPSVLDMIEKARKAQQRYHQTHDVQLEIDLDQDKENDDVGNNCSDEH